MRTKTCNVTMLATEKGYDYKQLILWQDGKLKLAPWSDTEGEFKNIHKAQHLYITSDEESKEGDYVIVGGKGVREVNFNDTKDPCKYIVVGESNAVLRSACKKVVASTDKSLSPKIHKEEVVDESYPDAFKNILPSIPESFIKAYIKAHNEGKPITEVDLELVDNGREEWMGDDYDGEPVWFEKLEIKTRPDGSVIVHQSKVNSNEEMHLNMQYYMEYCQRNGYVTPQEWIENHKHF